MSAPVCCGKPLQPQGQHIVCGTCGGWIDPGTR